MLIWQLNIDANYPVFDVYVVQYLCFPDFVFVFYLYPGDELLFNLQVNQRLFMKKKIHHGVDVQISIFHLNTAHVSKHAKLESPIRQGRRRLHDETIVLFRPY